MKLVKDLIRNHVIPGIRLSETRHICAKAASEILGITITPEQIDYHNDKVSFTVPPTAKTELLLQQERLLKKIRANGVSVSSLK